MAKIIDAAALHDQAIWARQTFGPGYRPGTIAHIRKELDEIEANPRDIEEWVDLIILAFDGAMRAGHRAQGIIDGYHTKRLKNMLREWPDWRNFSADEAIEHVR
jgi:hypothetical protein